MASPARAWSRFTTRLADHGALTNAIARGVVTEAEAAAFVADMESRDARERFVARLIGFNVVGTKPSRVDDG